MLGAVKTGLQGCALCGGTAWLCFRISVASLGANVVSVTVVFLKRGARGKGRVNKKEKSWVPM